MNTPGTLIYAMPHTVILHSIAFLGSVLYKSVSALGHTVLGFARAFVGVPHSRYLVVGDSHIFHSSLIFSAVTIYKNNEDTKKLSPVLHVALLETFLSGFISLCKHCFINWCNPETAVHYMYYGNWLEV